MTGLKICTRCLPISARRRRRINSSLLPENIGPTITSIQPMLPFTMSTLSPPPGVSLTQRTVNISPGWPQVPPPHGPPGPRRANLSIAAFVERGDAMAGPLRIRVNERLTEISSPPDTPLLYVLSDELRLQGPRFGCGLAQCGSCSVLLNGEEIRSCVTPVSVVQDKSVTTL